MSEVTVDFNVNDKVYISGEVMYSGHLYRVASNAVVEAVRPDNYLLTIEQVGGDLGVTVIVDKKYVHARS